MSTPGMCIWLLCDSLSSSLVYAFILLPSLYSLLFSLHQAVFQRQQLRIGLRDGHECDLPKTSIIFSGFICEVFKNNCFKIVLNQNELFNCVFLQKVPDSLLCTVYGKTFSTTTYFSISPSIANRNWNKSDPHDHLDVCSPLPSSAIYYSYFLCLHYWSSCLSPNVRFLKTSAILCSSGAA